MTIKITPFDAPYRDESNDIIYIKLFQEMVVMQALLMKSKFREGDPETKPKKAM